MSGVIGSELKPSGVLTRRERLTLLVGAPVIAIILGLEIVRIWRALQGGPLLITGFTDPDVVVLWSDGPVLFLLGLLLHLAIVALLTGALFFQFEQARRWLRSKREGN